MKKKLLLLVMVLVFCVSLLCACGETQSNIDPLGQADTDKKQEQIENKTDDTDKKQEETESKTDDTDKKQEETENKTDDTDKKQEETENKTDDTDKKQEETENEQKKEIEFKTPEKDKAYPKPSRENGDILARYSSSFVTAVKSAYSSKYGKGITVKNIYFKNTVRGEKGKIQANVYVLFLEVEKEEGEPTEETVAGITFCYSDNRKMSVYDSVSETPCDMGEAYEKGWLTANDIKTVKHKCDMEDFAAGDGLFLMKAYKEFRNTAGDDLCKMEITDYFGVYHGVHVAVIDPHNGLAAPVSQFDISGYWFEGIAAHTFVAYKDGEIKSMCELSDGSDAVWYTVNEWLTVEDIADINRKHLQHLECNYEY